MDENAVAIMFATDVLFTALVNKNNEELPLETIYNLVEVAETIVGKEHKKFEELDDWNLAKTLVASSAAYLLSDMQDIDSFRKHLQAMIVAYYRVKE